MPPDQTMALFFRSTCTFFFFPDIPLCMLFCSTETNILYHTQKLMANQIHVFAGHRLNIFNNGLMVTEDIWTNYDTQMNRCRGRQTDGRTGRQVSSDDKQMKNKNSSRTQKTKKNFSSQTSLSNKPAQQSTVTG